METTLYPGTYAGTPYLADEVAKKIVTELSLKDGDTVSRDQIISHLEKSGCGPMWASDVAMVLRNMFGVTPTFFESKSAVAKELHTLLEHTDAESYEMTDADWSFAFGMAVDSVFNESESEQDAMIIAALSQESLETVAAIADLSDLMSENTLDEAVALYQDGGFDLVEAWLDATSKPHMIRFMDESVTARISSVLGSDITQLSEAIPPEERQRRKMLKYQAGFRGLSGGSGTRQQAPDPLAAKGDGGTMMKMHQFNKAHAGDGSPEAQRGYANKMLRQATNQRGTSAPMPLPKDPGPSLAKRALSAVGGIASKIKSGLGSAANAAMSAGKSAGTAMSNAGIGGRIVAGAKRIAKGVGDAAGSAWDGSQGIRDRMRASARMRFPGLTNLIHGAPTQGEIDHIDSKIAFNKKMGDLRRSNEYARGMDRSYDSGQDDRASMPQRPTRSNVRRRGVAY